MGPNGKWEIIKPSGSPLCSWRIITSVKSLDIPNWITSFDLVYPLLILMEFGKIWEISLENSYNF